MGNYGLKVSKAGYDVKTATTDDLIYSSKYWPFKVIQVFNGTVTTTSGESYEEVQHSISSPYNTGSCWPAVIGFARLEATNNPNVSAPLGWRMLPANVTYGQISCYYKYSSGSNKACFLYNKPGYGSYYYTHRYKLLVLGDTCYY